MKKLLVPVSLTLSLGILFFANFLYPILNIITQKDETDLGYFRYLFIIATYVCLIFVVWVERRDLEVFNIDRLSLLTMLVAIFVRVKLHVFNEQLFTNSIWVVGLVLLGSCLLNWKEIPKTKTLWIIIGISTCVLVIPLAYFESFQTEKYVISNSLYQANFFTNLIRNLIFNLSFVSPFEEIIIRGVLWGQLRRLNIADGKIVWIQGVLFWLMHFWELFNWVTFFIVLPIVIATLSFLVFRSKQLFPSIVSHTLINTLIPVLVKIYS